MNSAIALHDFEQTTGLLSLERVRLAWSLTWPCLLADFIHEVLMRQFYDTTRHLLLDELKVGICLAVFITPWVVRRTVRADFPGFRLTVVRPGLTGNARDMTYLESLSVAWLLTWRALALFLLFSAVMAVPVAIFQAGSLFGGGWATTATAGAMLQLLVYYLWIVDAAVGKRYQSFSLELQRVKNERGDPRP